MCIVNYMYYMYKIYEIKANLYINSELSSIFNITNLHSTIDLCGPHRYFLDFLLPVHVFASDGNIKFKFTLHEIMVYFNCGSVIPFSYKLNVKIDTAEKLLQLTLCTLMFC